MPSLSETGRWPHWSTADVEGCEIAEDAVIEAEDVSIGAGTQIESGVRIAAREVRIGTGSRIERGTSIGGLGKPMERCHVGDQSIIGFETQILSPKFSMGDYSQLHNGGLHTGYQALSIGHNCWIGQNSILNCTERLTIGNNVRIGTQSQLWTHVASGELLEGCTLFGETPLTLEDNVWVVGGAVISPGLTLGRNSIIMTGSVLTRSTEPFHTYAGVPAKDVTDKLNFWKEVSPAEKLDMMRLFVNEFRVSNPEMGARVRVADQAEDLGGEPGDVVIADAVDDWDGARSRGVSVFDLATKRYLKQRSPAEIAWIRFTVGHRARFLPLDL